MEIVPLIFETAEAARKAKQDIWRTLDEQEFITLNQVYDICGYPVGADLDEYRIHQVTLFIRPVEKGKDQGKYELIIKGPISKRGAKA